MSCQIIDFSSYGKWIGPDAPTKRLKTPLTERLDRIAVLVDELNAISLALGRPATSSGHGHAGLTKSRRKRPDASRSRPDRSRTGKTEWGKRGEPQPVIDNAELERMYALLTSANECLAGFRGWKS